MRPGGRHGSEARSWGDGEMDGPEEWGGDAVEKVGEDGERKRGKGGRGERESRPHLKERQL